MSTGVKMGLQRVITVSTLSGALLVGLGGKAFEHYCALVAARMFPIIGAAASIFMVAQQNMLLWDLFHNRVNPNLELG